MFFWTRSLACIGTIVVLVAERAGEATVPTAAQQATSAFTASTTSHAVRLCQSAPDRCMAVLKQAAGTPALRDAALQLLQRSGTPNPASAGSRPSAPKPFEFGPHAPT